MDRAKINELIRFGCVGCIAVILQYVVYYMLLILVSYNVSYTIGYIFSFVVNYMLTTSFTFRVKKSKKNAVGFILSHILNYCMQVGFLNFFIYLGCNKQIAPIPVFTICTPLNFVMVRFFMKKF